MNCSSPIRIKTTSDTLRFTACRRCLACRLTRQYDWANRLQWEIARAGPDNCWFFTPTFTPEALEQHCMSDRIPPGVLTESQAKLETKLLKQKHKTPESRDRADRLIAEMYGENPSRPTVRKHIFQVWKKQVRNYLGQLPRILCVGEYGTDYGRPHGHAVLIGLTESQAQRCQDAWPHSVDHKPIERVKSEKIGSYISKDIVKGTWSSESYVASGREPPFMLSPKKPYLAQGQEDEIFNLLSRLRESTNDYDFEHRVQMQHVGRTFRVHYGPDNRRYREIAYGKTAYTKALARISRNETVKEHLADEARSKAHFAVTHQDKDHPHYLESHAQHHDQKVEKARTAVKRAKQRHQAILTRKTRISRAIL